MQKKILFLLFACVFLLWNNANAQVNQVTGKVVDAETNLPLPGANISVKGTTIGTATDMDGNYTLSIGSNDPVLLFTFVGYQSKEVLVAGQSVINVSLEVESATLDDVIVVAYGVTRKEASTGSVGVVKSEELEKLTLTSPEKAIQGKVAGVQVNNVSGQPGGSAEILIRGISTVTSGRSPLIVLDGVPLIEFQNDIGAQTYDNNAMANINPADIESITVLKDAASTSVYGSRASNGVILINTKSGRKGDAKFELNTKYGISSLANYNNFRMMNSSELLDYSRAAAVNAGENPDDPGSTYYFPLSLLDGPETDWYDEAFRTGKTTSVDLSASGGNEKTNYYLSGGYYDEEGIMIGTAFKRFSLNMNLNSQATKKLKVGGKLNASYSKNNDVPQQWFWANPMIAAQRSLPWENVYNADGSIDWDIPSASNYNLVGIGKYFERYDKFYRGLTSVFLEYEIIEGLTLKTNNSVDFIHNKSREFWTPRIPEAANAGDGGGGWLNENTTTNYNLLTSNTLNYIKELEGVGTIRLLIGQESQYNNYERYGMFAEGIGEISPWVTTATDEYQTLGYDYGEISLLSYFGIADYNFDDKYLFSASLRRDASSRFAADSKWGAFYSVGASWNMHNESFVENINLIKLFKLRASYGTTGNYQIGNYLYLESYGNTQYNGDQAAFPVRLGDDNLRWEKSATFDVGIDVNLFGRLDIVVDYYNRKTTDMLLNVPLQGTTGLVSQTRNAGDMKNMGVELFIKATVLKTESSQLSLNANISYNESEITDLNGQNVFFGSGERAAIEGGPAQQYYLSDWAGVNPATGVGMWYDENGQLTENVNNARKVAFGQTTPKYLGGFGLTYSWKGLTITPAFEFKTGHYILFPEMSHSRSDGQQIGRNQLATQTEYWKQPGDIVANPIPVAGNISGSSYRYSDRFLEKADYLRFKQLNINYSLPKKWITAAKLNSVNVYFEASNLYVWHDVYYFDPERESNFRTVGSYPMPKKYLFGIKLGF